jgi:hypothetical protein
MMRTVFGCCLITIIAVLPAGGAEPMTLSVTPAQSFAPATVRVRARIEPRAENRRLALVADGPNFYRSSEFQLDGEHGPKTVELYFSNLPGGDYEIYAVLSDSSGRQRAVVHLPATVIGFGDGH